jgi:LysR family transcriptional regulator, glycine cleavage system transcriptional activator
MDSQSRNCLRQCDCHLANRIEGIRSLPLNSLRVFDAVVRRGSVTDAASELGVTAGAIYRQLNSLEDWLGTPLWERSQTALKLTDSGLEVAAVTHAALAAISEAASHARGVTASQVVRINSDRAFASRWLVPRLSRFRVRFPQIQIWIYDSQDEHALEQGGCDFVISRSANGQRHIRSDPLTDDLLFPVCAPEVARQVKTSSDLKDFPLLADNHSKNWLTWVTAVTGAHMPHTFCSLFDDHSLALQAAIEGQGLAITLGTLCVDDLLSGKLVRPFSQAVPISDAYWLHTIKHIEPRRNVRRFVNWLRAEISGTTSKLTGATIDASQASEPAGEARVG